MFLFVDFPSWLKPEIIPGTPLRWYGLMYIFAFGTAYFIYRRQLRERAFPMNKDQLYSLFCWAILGLLLGARIFSTLIYETSSYYRTQPWLIFWPFRDGKFTGLQGMSYHGGAVGGFLAILIFCKVKKFNFREIGDMFAAAIPLGYTFGRLGNFINGELYGRVTASPLGMLFPNAATVPTKESWVVEIAEKVGIDITGLASVNLPRHPSQLYEMIFEGIVLWAIIWVFRNRKPFKGFLIGLYFLGYGFFRFLIEYFRQPDSQMGDGGFILPGITTGQILCFLMMVFGIIWIVVCSKLPGREPFRIGDSEKNSFGQGKSMSERKNERNQRRKLRKKLQ